jgi:sugar porter (SP) family MFS transporter
MPSSPRWLVLKKREADAAKIIKRFMGPTATDQEVSSSLSEMKKSVSMQKGVKLSDLFSPQVKMATLIGVGLAILQQATGINTVIYYAPTIFQYAGLNVAATAITASIYVGAVNVAFTVASLFLVDRLGRRPLLLISLAGMVIALSGLGISFLIGLQGGGTGTVAVVLLMFYVAAFAIGLGPVFWLLISEIYPLRVRGQAMSLATVANWGTNLIISVTFLGLVSVLGKGGIFILYAIIGVGAWIFIWRLVPETKNLSL